MAAEACPVCGRPSTLADGGCAVAFRRFGKMPPAVEVATCYRLGYEREKLRADSAVADLRVDADLLARAESQINGLKAEVASLRASLRLLASHDPPWLDDHIRARAALGEAL